MHAIGFPAMAALAGVDLGGTKIQAVVCREDGEVLGQARHPTPLSGGGDKVAEAVSTAAKEACSEAGLELRELQALGVGAPGAVDSERGVVLSAPNLPALDDGFALAEAAARRLDGVRVTLVNDVAAGIEGEHRLGAGRPYRSLLGVFAGTGVGGGLVLDGRPWHGRGSAGEIGHVVVRVGGARCGCGRRGCLEAYAGRASMERRARREVERGRRTVLFRIQERKGRPRLTSGVFADALEQKDALAMWLIDRAVRALGAGIASVQNMLDLEAVILGGGLADRLGPPFVERVRTAMQPHLFVPERPPEVLPSGLGDLGGALGAALLAADPS